jgi:hypothetical protein
MSERLDELARTLASRTPRRTALLGLGSLGLGSLGILGLGRGSEAKSNINRCNVCKRQCRHNNQKQGKKNKRNCSNKCRTKCNKNR